MEPNLMFAAVMKGTDLSKANLKEAQFSKGFLQGTVLVMASLCSSFRVLNIS